jgi:hypothetical protein
MATTTSLSNTGSSSIRGDQAELPAVEGATQLSAETASSLRERVAFMRRNPEEMDMAKKVSGEKKYEYRCGEYNAGCAVVITTDTADGTALLAAQHVNATHSGESATVESISDHINPRLAR